MNANALPNASAAGSPLGASSTARIVAATSVTASCRIAHTTSARSVTGSVVRLRLRVMLTTTTELESATARPSVTAPEHAGAERGERESARDRADRDLQRHREEDPARLAPQRAQIKLDADLEQKEHDADIGEHLDLLAGPPHTPA